MYIVVYPSTVSIWQVENEDILTESLWLEISSQVTQYVDHVGSNTSHLPIVYVESNGWSSAVGLSHVSDVAWGPVVWFTFHDHNSLANWNVPLNCFIKLQKV